MGRPHIAKTLLEKYPDKFSDTDEIFDVYLGTGKIGYVERREKISVKEAVHAIHSAGGLAFAAHPGVYKNFDPVSFIEFFVNNKGDGVETYYSYESSRHKITEKMSDSIIKKYRSIAMKMRLLETGGSDFHGKDEQKLGRLKVPYSVLENLKKSIG